MGPLEYAVIEFEGNHFSGEIMPELEALADQGVARLVDLVFIQRDGGGNVTVRELSDFSGEEAQLYAPIAGKMLGLLGREDIDDVAAEVPNNSSVALALLEHTWAIRLREMIRKAHGRVVAGGLLPAAEVQALDEELAARQVAMSAGSDDVAAESAAP